MFHFLSICLLVGVVVLNCGCNRQETSSAASSGAEQPAVETVDYKALLSQYRCTTCHRVMEADRGSTIGPAYETIAAHYDDESKETVDHLVHKVLNGGAGTFGKTMMTPNKHVPEEDAQLIVKYILTINDTK